MTEAMPFLQKYDITFLRPLPIAMRAFGGGGWIRTTVGIASRFTVCPLWPLGNTPICT